MADIQRVRLPAPLAKVPIACTTAALGAQAIKAETDDNEAGDPVDGEQCSEAASPLLAAMSLQLSRCSRDHPFMGNRSPPIRPCRKLVIAGGVTLGCAPSP